MYRCLQTVVKTKPKLSHVRSRHYFTRLRAQEVSFLSKHISSFPLSLNLFLAAFFVTSVGQINMQGKDASEEMWMQFRELKCTQTPFPQSAHTSSASALSLSLAKWKIETPFISWKHSPPLPSIPPHAFYRCYQTFWAPSRHRPTDGMKV